MPRIDPSHPWVAAALALLAGAAMPLAFAPFGWWPVAGLGLALLFHLWSRATPRAAFGLGWLFGLGAALMGLGAVALWLRAIFLDPEEALDRPSDGAGVSPG